jgi:hypothetical protein
MAATTAGAWQLQLTLQLQLQLLCRSTAIAACGAPKANPLFLVPKRNPGCAGVCLMGQRQHAQRTADCHTQLL